MSNLSDRRARIERRTLETQLTVELNLDGMGQFEGQVGVPFLEHMLHQFARHGAFDLTISGKGDTLIDDHHTTEDLGIVLGQCIKECLGAKVGIRRYGEAYVPMEETLVRCVLDVCNRPYLYFGIEIPKTKVGTFDAELAEDFFRALAFNSGTTVHMDMIRGGNVHHILEAAFKSYGRALGQAVRRDSTVQGVLSTKGTIS
jgi:imidazoleglycerol-phosphate dehydratase